MKGSASAFLPPMVASRRSPGPLGAAALSVTRFVDSVRAFRWMMTNSPEAAALLRSLSRPAPERGRSTMDTCADPAAHRHCDCDPVECSYQALVGEYEERGRRIADLERQVALLDDHHAAAAYGCPNCGVHHGCFEMVERNQQLEAEVARLRPRRRGRLVTAILRAGQTVTTEVPADRQWRNPLDPRLPPRSRP